MKKPAILTLKLSIAAVDVAVKKDWGVAIVGVRYWGIRLWGLKEEV